MVSTQGSELFQATEGKIKPLCSYKLFLFAPIEADSCFLRMQPCQITSSASSLRIVFFSGDSFSALMGVTKERGTTEGGMRQEERKRKPVREASPNSMWIS